ncbi:hypothetical protein F383_06828 [Gossypium arboreum]|uniref:Uncharacterized protein n=1 Tax=Gossypium arboreum TaxID=29729 RepID=A0A0B0PG54_GOSAR|nr:hypothetical protein F383_06828 [Gossypium arboreum]
MILVQTYCSWNLLIQSRLSLTGYW